MTLPDWVVSQRAAASDAYSAASLPGMRDELWRFTDLKLLDPAQFQHPDSQTVLPALPAKANSALELSGVDSAGRAIHADATTIDVRLSPEAESKGVVFKPLAEAVETHRQILEPRLGALIGSDDIFGALSLSSWRGGMFLYVPKGVELETPIQALHWASEPGSVLLPRTVVVAEESSKIIFNDLYASEDLPQPTFAMPVVEVFAGPNSNVGWVTWQDWGRGMRHLARIKAHLDRDATVNNLVVTLGGDFSRTEKGCVLAGPGSESYMYGLYFPHDDQQFEHYTVQDHAAPNAISDLLYKGAVADESKAVYYGTIMVRHGASKTNAYQANRNLTLSPHARALTNPQLEINNNDVRCTHGATVGQIDENHLFYLQSRGVPRAEAERLLVFGFFNEVLERVQWSGMHERLAEAIRAKMFAAREISGS